MEKKEHHFVGKHYLMKQAFGQEELHEREAVCTREEPPACTSACPLHLDMRQACALAAQGIFPGQPVSCVRQLPFFICWQGVVTLPVKKAVLWKTWATGFLCR